MLNITGLDSQTQTVISIAPLILIHFVLFHSHRNELEDLYQTQHQHQDEWMKSQMLFQCVRLHC